jgi:CDP-paratose 2-epimerase
MKWLITGGCGFVGSNLANTLLENNDEIIILDNLSRVGSEKNLQWLKSLYGSQFEFIQGDTRDYETIVKTIKEHNLDAIAHLAGQVAMTTSLANPRLDFEVNALGTFNILEAVRLFSATTIVLYSSTNKVYGALDSVRYLEKDKRYISPDFPNGFSEDLSLDGLSPYGCSKLAADQYMRDYYRMYQIPTVVFRHSSMYGGRQFATFDQGWIGWFCQKSLEMKSLQAEEFTINGNGKQVRDVLHSQDLVSVYRRAAAFINNTAGKIYNIGGGMENSLSLLELFELLESYTGNLMRFKKIEWRHGDQKVFVADTTKAFKDFGWKPVVDKEIGICQMLDWSREAMNA